MTSLMGRRERVRRGGYPTRAAARHARDQVPARSREDQTSQAWTLQRWLRYWLSTRVDIRPTTRLSHTQYIERFLISPGFLTHRLAALVAAAGLPPVRLQDLRHGAATLAHLAGTDLKTI
ncbi:MAG: hypothetical protein ACRDSH_24645 [Pseudonocardiaceae bacterium]